MKMTELLFSEKVLIHLKFEYVLFQETECPKDGHRTYYSDFSMHGGGGGNKGRRGGCILFKRTYHIEQSGHVFSITDILFATFLDCTHHGSQGISSELAGQILQMWFLPTTNNKNPIISNTAFLPTTYSLLYLTCLHIVTKQS